MALRGGRIVGPLVAAALCLGLLVPVRSTGAAPGERGRDNATIRKMIDRMTLEEKVGQMFMTYAYGQSADDPDPAMVASNQQTYGVDNFEQLIDEYHLGGIIYFAWSNNVNNPTQIAGLSNGIQDSALSQRSAIPLLVSTDQEQGVVVRVGPPATQFPGNMGLGAAREATYARTAAEITGRELRAIGINENFAPVADVNVNAQNPVIGVRSFGSDPGLVSTLTAAQVEGYQSQNVSSTAKHFPGHGDTNVDSHTGLPVIHHNREELDTIDLPPFESAIERDIDAIMTAHIVVPALDDSGRPATLSKPILTGLLREQMDFDGLIVTDALTMEGVRQMYGDERVPVEAIKAGADVLLMPPDLDLAYNAVLEAVRSGEVGVGRINKSVYRILSLKMERGLFKNPYVDEDAVPSKVGTPGHLATADEITNKTVTLVKNDDDVLPLQANSSQDVLVTGWGVSTTKTLADSIAERGATTEVYETGVNPNEAQRQTAVTKAGSKDLVVVSSQRAWISSGQQALIRDLLATGTPVIVLAVRDPYDIAYFTDAPTYVATYSYSPVSLKATTRVLFGEVNPTGRLPVAIPTADDPDTELYPYGHGLSYGG
ncbi:MAG: glycoside hydrolase family 3 protein [Actinomycetota bacterium]|nr:glycoside hydrolase family 3 protein [Actinomycetota bacterium]